MPLEVNLPPPSWWRRLYAKCWELIAPRDTPVYGVLQDILQLLFILQNPFFLFCYFLFLFSSFSFFLPLLRGGKGRGERGDAHCFDLFVLYFSYLDLFFLSPSFSLLGCTPASKQSMVGASGDFYSSISEPSKP